MGDSKLPVQSHDRGQLKHIDVRIAPPGENGVNLPPAGGKHIINGNRLNARLFTEAGLCKEGAREAPRELLPKKKTRSPLRDGGGIKLRGANKGAERVAAESGADTGKATSSLTTKLL